LKFDDELATKLSKVHSQPVLPKRRAIGAQPSISSLNEDDNDPPAS